MYLHAHSRGKPNISTDFAQTTCSTRSERGTRLETSKKYGTVVGVGEETEKYTSSIFVVSQDRTENGVA